MAESLKTYVTIVACKPGYGDPPTAPGAIPGELETDQPVPGGEGNGPIDDIIKELATRDKNNHRVFRAYRLKQIQHIMKVTAGTCDVLQIVGHGLPGVLLLGAGWNPTLVLKGDEARLDSNPYAYQLLDVTPLPKEIWLLGCDLGYGQPATTVQDGCTLLYALARMWKIPVKGPSALISSTDFVAGVYGRSWELVTADVKGVTAPVRRVATSAARTPWIDAVS